MGDADVSKKSPEKKLKSRNWLAVHAHQRGGAGSHGDLKKQKSKKACRGKVCLNVSR